MPYNLKIEMWRKYAMLRDIPRWMGAYSWGPLKHETFMLNEDEYSYCVHPYNHTWQNERAVEIPIFQRFLKGCSPDSILEVGAVMPHYTAHRHDVVDLYEVALLRHYMRADFLTWQSPKKYKRILSISTFEHIGMDDGNPRESVLAVPSKLRALLTPHGQAVISVPIGYNLCIDDAIRRDNFGASSIRFLKRISVDNRWEETDAKCALACKYNNPYPCAGAIMIATYLGG